MLIGILSTLLVLMTIYAVWITVKGIQVAKELMETRQLLITRVEELNKALVTIQQMWQRDPDPLDADIIQ